MTVRLRRASSADTQLLFEWTNDVADRANSKNTEPVGWDDHVRWVADSLAAPDRELWIAERDGMPVGLARIDHLDAGAAELSYSVAPGSRGQGIGKEIVRLALNMAEKRDLFAKIKLGNEPSIRIVRALGFTELWRENGLLVYHLKRNLSV
jgi:RimJ/RimL family protein N-acetyltransferase